MSRAGFGQLVCIILLAVFIGFSFFGKSDTVKTAEEIAEEVTARLSTEGLEQFDESKLFSQLGLDSEQFDSFVYYGSEDVMDVREIIVIRDKEKADLDGAAGLIEKKAVEKYNTYKDYDPLASSLLEKRIIQVSRGAIIYIVHDDAAEGLDAFLRCIEE